VVAQAMSGPFVTDKSNPTGGEPTSPEPSRTVPKRRSPSDMPEAARARKAAYRARLKAQKGVAAPAARLARDSRSVGMPTEQATYSGPGATVNGHIDRRDEHGDDTQYTPQFRAAAIAIGLAIGPLAASEQLHIPIGTLRRWLHGDEAREYVAMNRAEMADLTWRTFQSAVETSMAALADPRTRAHDRARILEVIGRTNALVSGQPTSRVEFVGELDVRGSLVDNLTYQERQDMIGIVKEAIEISRRIDSLPPDKRAEFEALGMTASTLLEPLALPAGDVVEAEVREVDDSPLTPEEQAQLRAWLQLHPEELGDA
jgi:hypothetical protein